MTLLSAVLLAAVALYLWAMRLARRAPDYRTVQLESPACDEMMESPAGGDMTEAPRPQAHYGMARQTMTLPVGEHMHLLSAAAAPGLPAMDLELSGARRAHQPQPAAVMHVCEQEPAGREPAPVATGAHQVSL